MRLLLETSPASRHVKVGVGGSGVGLKSGVCWEERKREVERGGGGEEKEKGGGR